MIMSIAKNTSYTWVSQDCHWECVFKLLAFSTILAHPHRPLAKLEVLKARLHKRFWLSV